MAKYILILMTLGNKKVYSPIFLFSDLSPSVLISMTNCPAQHAFHKNSKKIEVNSREGKIP